MLTGTISEQRLAGVKAELLWLLVRKIFNLELLYVMYSICINCNEKVKNVQTEIERMKIDVLEASETR